MWAYRFFWLTHSYTQSVSSLITVNNLESIGVCVFGWCHLSSTQIYGTINMVRNNMCHIYMVSLIKKDWYCTCICVDMPIMSMPLYNISPFIC